MRVATLVALLTPLIFFPSTLRGSEPNVVLDIALVISPQKADSPYTTTFLTTFMSSFARQLKIDADHARVAVINAFVANENGYLVENRNVLLTLKEGQSAEAVQNIWATKGSLKGDAEYSPLLLAKHVNEKVFGGDGDRPYVPNVIIYLMIMKQLPYDVNAMHLKINKTNYPGVSVRMVAHFFGDSNPSGHVLINSDGGRPFMASSSNAARDLVLDLQRLTSACKVREASGQCLYRDEQRTSCQFDHDYQLLRDSKPPGYCVNGSETRDCASGEMCKKACEKGVYWSCNCGTGMEKKVKNTSSIFKFCPPINAEERKCQSTQSCPPILSVGAIVGICVGSAALILIIVVAVVLMIMSKRDSQRRRNRARQDNRGQSHRLDRSRQPSPSGYGRSRSRNQTRR